MISHNKIWMHFLLLHFNKESIQSFFFFIYYQLQSSASIRSLHSFHFHHSRSWRHRKDKKKSSELNYAIKVESWEHLSLGCGCGKCEISFKVLTEGQHPPLLPNAVTSSPKAALFPSKVWQRGNTEKHCWKHRLLFIYVSVCHFSCRLCSGMHSLFKGPIVHLFSEL